MRSTDRAHAAPARTRLPSPSVEAEGTPGGWPDGIRDALAAGRDVVVLGEAGIGKTHLVDLALRGRPPGGAAVVEIPTRGRTRGAASPATLEHPFGTDDLQTGPEAAGEALWCWAQARAGTPRVLVRLEDAHLLDDDDLRIVEHAVRRPEATLVATTRADPNVPPVLTGLPNLVRFRARPLDTAAVETLLIDLLGGFPTADTVHRLWVASRGNPFHLRELVRDQQERGALVSDDDIWVWTGAAALSGRVLDAALHDLAFLEPDEREAVELAAVAGAVPAAAVAQPVRDRLLRLGLLRLVTPPEPSTSTPRLEVAHPLQADAICAQVGTRRRRELLDRAHGWRVESAPGADDLVRSVARSVGAQVDVSLPELLRACGHAVRSDDPHAAVEITSAALRRATAGHDSIAILTARADAHLHLNDTEAALRDLDAARASLERLDRTSHQVLDAYLRTVRLQAMVLQFLACDLDATLAHLEAAVLWLRPVAGTFDRPARVLRSIEALHLGHLAWGGRHADMLDSAVEMLRDPPHPEDVAALVGPTVFALTLAGRCEEAERLNERFLPVVAAHPALHRWEPAVFTLTRFFVLVAAGETDAADRTGPLPGTLIDMVGLHQRRGVLAAARGSWTAARHELRAANVRLRLRDSLGILAYTLSWEALVAAASGDQAGARELLDELRGTPRRCSLVAGALLDLNILDALIWLRDPGAAALAAKLTASAARDGMHGVELASLHRAAVIGGADGARRLVAGPLEDHLEHLGQHLEGRRAEALLAHLRAMTGKRSQLAPAAARLPEVGVWLPCLDAQTRLTRREREIATLAAGGMTSRAIAQRLVVSVRTVDSHLAGAYTKLGVHSREGLMAALQLVTAPHRPAPS